MQRRTGLLRRRFPTQPEFQPTISIEQWRATAAPFFFSDRSQVSVSRHPTPELQDVKERFDQGELRFFRAQYRKIGRDYDWLTNPDSGYRYDSQAHWTDVVDFSPECGDIKFCWEKSRFTFLYDLIRHDHHFETDCAEIVFQEIDHWIAANRINCGPNFRCSQEIAVRVLNWTFAIYFYRHSPSLTQARFDRIMHLIYWQLHHVYHNIGFSRNCVRNNHAITESLVLYLGGLLFPFLPDVAQWSRCGKRWLDEEIEYQVYADGTYLQHSHNYHRVLVQLLTWYLSLSHIHDQPVPDCSLERAEGALDYLVCMADRQSGQLPNYGMNDGALFFPLSTSHYRDYRPQINALHQHLYGSVCYNDVHLQEDTQWLSPTTRRRRKPSPPAPAVAAATFPHGGIYTLRSGPMFVFIPCVSYRDRPFQADGLHLDLWYDGKNYLRDSGSYKYNTDAQWVRYFSGTSGHNTVMLGNHDQMLKGPRFLWAYWTRCLEAVCQRRDDGLHFEGTISAFRQLARGIRHTRRVDVLGSPPKLVVVDRVTHRTGLPMKQHWNVAPEFDAQFRITATDSDGQVISEERQPAWFSEFYGIKEPTEAIIFQSPGHEIRTVIEKR